MSSKVGKSKIEAHMCSVCDEAEGRYKCPRCRVPYCSVGCCKTHKETCGQQLNIKSVDTKASPGDASALSPSTGAADSDIVLPTVNNTTTTTTTRQPTSMPNDSFDHGDLAIITEQQKQQLAKCVELRALLRSKRLQDRVTEVDGAGAGSGVGRRAALKRARANPEFEAFLGVMLRAVGFAGLVGHQEGGASTRRP